MSALSLSIPALLVGKHYRSRNRFFSGEIISAEKRDGIWYGENTEAYLIGVNAKGKLSTQYATIAVKVGE